jgi:hypothetical protein
MAKVSIEEMKKVIESHVHERKTLEQPNLSEDTISEIYDRIIAGDKNRDAETIRRLHEFIEKRRV